MKPLYPFAISALIIATIALGNAGSTLYLPAMPTIVLALDTTPSMMKWSLSLFLIGFGVSQLVYGPLSDVFGRRINLMVGLCIFIVGSFLASWAQDMSMLLLGRWIEGLGIGAVNAVGYAVLRDLYHGPTLTLQLSYLSIFVGAVPLIAPVIGGYLVDTLNWQACFDLLAMVAIFLLILITIFLPETLRERDGSAWHLRVMVRKYNLLLTSKYYMGCALTAAIAFAAIFTTGSTLPFLLINGLGMSPSLCGWIAGTPAIGYLVGSFVSGRLSLKISLFRLILMGSWMGIVSMVMALVIHWHADTFTVYTLTIPLLFFMFGVGFLVPAGASGAMALFPGMAGSESALLCAFMFCFAALLTAIASHLVVAGPIPLFFLLGFVCVLTLCFLAMAKKGMNAVIFARIAERKE